MNKDEKIDILYVLHSKPSIGEMDFLRYSLRSIEKHLSNIGNVYAVGDDISSKFNSSLINIVNPSMAMNRTVNELKYIHSFANLPSISNNFILIDERSYLCNDYDGTKMPFCSHTKIRKEEDSAHMINTYKLLRHRTLSLNNYNNHAPMMFNKKRIKELFENVEFPVTNICIKSVYANYFKKRFDFFVPMVFDNPATDKDTAMALIRRKNMFSIDSVVLRTNMHQVLYLLYPKKSKWEL